MSLSDFIEVVAGVGVSCEGCDLDRRNFVPSRLVSGSDIAFVGEAPGRNEVVIGEPFVGKAGQVLRDACRDEGIDPSSCSMANIVSCRPPHNSTPDKSLMLRCAKKHLYPQMMALKPKIIVLLGKTAYGYFFDMKTWGKWLHNFRRSGEFTFIALRHPSYINHQYDTGRELGDKEYSLFRRDLAKAKRFLEGTLYSDRKYIQISSAEEAEWWSDFLCEKDTIAADIEGVPLRPWDPDACLFSVSFSWTDKKSICFPVDHREVEDERFKSAVRKALDKIFRCNNTKIWHNAKFDTNWLRYFGWVINGKQICTMIMAYLVDENRGKGQYGLKQLSAVHLDGYNEIVEGDEFLSVGLERLCLYNCEDTDNTWRLYHILEKSMDDKLWWVHDNLLIPGGDALAEAERVGFYWDLDKNGKLKSELVGQIEHKVREADKKLPHGKTVTSSDDLRDYLYNDNNFPVISTTKKGTPQVNEYTLKVLAEDHKCKIAKQIIDIRKLKKKVDTYLNGFPKFVGFDGRIHPTFWLTNTTTGRTAAEKPGAQQIPRDVSIRELLAAEDGREIMEGDLSNAEMRVAASLSGDRVLCDVFRRDGDVHVTTAAQVNGIPEEEVNDDLRQKAKPVNFGFMYGQQVDGFIAYARKEYGIVFTPAEAAEIRDRYFDTYSGLPLWYRDVIEELYQNEAVRTVFGRLRRFPGLISRDSVDQEKCQRQAINTLVQSPSADLMLLIFIHVQNELVSRKMESRAVLTVHDSLLTDGPSDEVSEVARIANDYVESFSFPWLTVPMRMDFKRGKRWNKKTMTDMKKGGDF